MIGSIIGQQLAQNDCGKKMLFLLFKLYIYLKKINSSIKYLCKVYVNIWYNLTKVNYVL